jgi:hypothetical protein
VATTNTGGNGGNKELSKDKYDELFTLYRRTNKANPKPEDVTALRRFLFEHPEKAKYIGDLSMQAEVQLIEQALSNNKGAEIATTEVLHKMSEALGIDTAPAIERPLISHVCLCWLRLQLYEVRYTEASSGSLSLAQGAYMEKKLSEHQKRYLRAVETLARIRKLNINIQINMAHQQIVTG